MNRLEEELWANNEIENVFVVLTSIDDKIYFFLNLRMNFTAYMYLLCRVFLS